MIAPLYRRGRESGSAMRRTQHVRGLDIAAIGISALRVGLAVRITTLTAAAAAAVAADGSSVCSCELVDR